jgi:hypothetical protein
MMSRLFLNSHARTTSMRWSRPVAVWFGVYVCLLGVLRRFAQALWLSAHFYKVGRSADDSVWLCNLGSRVSQMIVECKFDPALNRVPGTPPRLHAVFFYL